MLSDNVADLELVKRALPATRGGSLLFTTRLHTLGTLAHRILLEPLSVEEGRHLLLRRAGYAGPDTAEERLAPIDEAACSGLVLAMDGLPLALDQAGAYIAQTHTSVSAFLHLFQQDPCQLLGERDAHAEHPCSVVHTFTRAFERLQQANPAAAELLSLCCFLAPEAIPEALLTEHPAHLGPALSAVVAHPLQFNALCQDLLASSLLRRDGQTHTLTIPPLVGAILRGSMPEEAQRQSLSLTLFGGKGSEEAQEIVTPSRRRTLSLEDDLLWMHPSYYGSNGTNKSSTFLKECMGIRRKPWR